MRAIVKTKPGTGFELIDVPKPEIGPHDALIRVKAVGICGTDVHIYQWDAWSRARIRPPVVGGHEFVGVVEALGRDVRHIEPGVRVSGEGHITCGHCRFCRTGRAHICQNVRIIGIDRDGCFADYLSMPADNLWPVPDEIADRHAAIFDPLGNAMHSVTAADISGRSVLIIGAGAIGLFSTAIARAAGASKVLVSEPNAMKREIAARVGADVVFDPAAGDIGAALLEATEGLGSEVVMEMSGSAAGLKSAFGFVQNGGDVVLLGLPADEVAVNWARDIIFKGITIHAVSGRRMYDTWYRCQRFLLGGRVDIDPVITHTIRLEDFEKGFEALLTGKAAKVVMTL
ncbi:MAG: L-threonine 3-dehydrogenase [Planctomycetes bacterium]|nr:L-threonine 3-dehydrogenase [Planctomycetota bacterium]